VTGPRTLSRPRSRFAAALAGCVIVVAALSGCAPAEVPLQQATAAQLQKGVLDVTKTSAAGDFAGAQAALTAVEADLRTAAASDQVTADRAAEIQSAINLVAADLAKEVAAAEAAKEAADEAAKAAAEEAARVAEEEAARKAEEDAKAAKAAEEAAKKAAKKGQTETPTPTPTPTETEEPDDSGSPIKDGECERQDNCDESS